VPFCAATSTPGPSPHLHRDRRHICTGTVATSAPGPSPHLQWDRRHICNGTCFRYVGSQVTLQGVHFAEYDDYDVLVGGIRVNGPGVFRTVLVNETAGLLFSVEFSEVCAQPVCEHADGFCRQRCGVNSLSRHAEWLQIDVASQRVPVTAGHRRCRVGAKSLKSAPVFACNGGVFSECHGCG
jgi:hypothetical protein